MRKLTTEQFIEKAKKVHGELYDYSLVEYENNDTKIKIVCKIHGVFTQIPKNHLIGIGCRECCFINRGIKLTGTTEQFIEKAKKVHGELYDYSLVEYENNDTKIKIVCKIHGVFTQIPKNHLIGIGCRECCFINRGIKLTGTTEQFIEKAKKVHGELYDYSLVEYENNGTKIKIVCKIHGVFTQTPNRHLSGTRCPTCSESKGETFIADYLIKKQIKFEQQKRFPDCKYKYPLPFDFYLPEQNIFIEFNGIQHYKEDKKHFHKENSFEYQKLRDSIKRKYGKKNGTYIEIKYNSDIEKVLNKALEGILDDRRT